MTMRKTILDFFAKNPNPPDKKVHAFAESLGMDEHKFEEEIYKVISSFAAHGKYEDENEPDVPASQVQKGIKVEKEHTTSPEMAARISKDHLSEFKDYYTRLDKMEEQAKAEKKAAFILGFKKVAAQLLDSAPAKPQKDLVTPEMDRGNRRVLEGVKTNKQHLEQVSSKKKAPDAQFKVAFIGGLANAAWSLGSKIPGVARLGGMISKAAPGLSGMWNKGIGETLARYGGGLGKSLAGKGNRISSVASRIASRGANAGPGYMTRKLNTLGRLGKMEAALPSVPGWMGKPVTFGDVGGYMGTSWALNKALG